MGSIVYSHIQSKVFLKIQKIIWAYVAYITDMLICLPLAA